jgi:hypothetical protein
MNEQEQPGAHHLTPENIAATIKDLREIEDGTTSFPVENRDWRTMAGVLARIIEHLASPAVSQKTAPEAPACAACNGEGQYEHKGSDTKCRVCGGTGAAPATQQAVSQMDGAAKLDLTDYSRAVNYANGTSTTVIPPAATTASASETEIAEANAKCAGCWGECGTCALDLLPKLERRAQAPSRDAAPMDEVQIVEIFNRVQGRWSSFGGPLNAVLKFAREIERTAVAQQGASYAANAGEDTIAALIAAVRKLVKAKGRYHSEQNYLAMVAALDMFDAHAALATGATREAK